MIRFDAARLNLLFPAFLATDRALVLTAVGPSVLRLSRSVRPGGRLLDLFEVDHPVGEFDPEQLAQSGASLILRARDKSLRLRGVIIREADGYILFVTHSPTNLQAWVDQGLRFDDFSPADSALDALMAVELQRALLAETRELVVELAAARDAAQAADRAKSEFLANMSHEIRTPLHGVIGIIGALSNSPLNAQQAEMVSLIQGSADDLTRVVSDVLDFARLEANTLDVVERPTDLRPCLEAAAEGARAAAAAKGLHYRVDIDSSATGVYRLDAPRLKQIFDALLSNAVKFTDAGEVTFSARRTGQGANLRLAVDVADTGIGLPPNKRDEVFRGFVQGDASSTRRHTGSGLGLAICKALADRMRGALTVESEPGRGSCFHLEVPLLDPTPSSEAVGGPAAVGSIGVDLAIETAQTKLRCLVAEDHPANRRIIELMLSPLGIDVTLARNGAEAVELFLQGDWNMILMDMQMPVMDGIAAVRAMRRIEQDQGAPRTPIAMLSANVLPRHVEAAMSAGADHFIGKPVTPASLVQGLERLIEGVQEETPRQD